MNENTSECNKSFNLIIFDSSQGAVILGSSPHY